MEEGSTMDRGNMFEGKYSIEFSERTIRAAFVKKVFFLVFIMMTIVSVLCAVPFMIPAFGDWLTGRSSDGNYDNYSAGAAWVYITAIIVFLVFSILLSCVPKLRRSYPVNLICLCIFTLSAGVMTMCITAFFTVQSVLLGLIMTAGICGAIMVFAAFIKKDLTCMMGFMYLFAIWLLFFGLTASIAIWVCGVTFLNTLYGALAAIFFMLWLAIDVQLVMGGRRFEISPEEYVFAAMTIFLDILNIFLYILQIFGKVK